MGEMMHEKNTRRHTMRIKDRDDYRSMTNGELMIEMKEALRINYEDMAMVLAERLVAAGREQGYFAND